MDTEFTSKNGGHARLQIREGSIQNAKPTANSCSEFQAHCHFMLNSAFYVKIRGISIINFIIPIMLPEREGAKYLLDGT